MKRVVIKAYFLILNTFSLILLISGQAFTILNKVFTLCTEGTLGSTEMEDMKKRVSETCKDF